MDLKCSSDIFCLFLNKLGLKKEGKIVIIYSLIKNVLVVFKNIYSKKYDFN